MHRGVEPDDPPAQCCLEFLDVSRLQRCTAQRSEPTPRAKTLAAKELVPKLNVLRWLCLAPLGGRRASSQVSCQQRGIELGVFAGSSKRGMAFVNQLAGPSAHRRE